MRPSTILLADSGSLCYANEDGYRLADDCEDKGSCPEIMQF